MEVLRSSIYRPIKVAKPTVGSDEGYERACWGFLDQTQDTLRLKQKGEVFVFMVYKGFLKFPWGADRTKPMIFNNLPRRSA